MKKYLSLILVIICLIACTIPARADLFGGLGGLLGDVFGTEEKPAEFTGKTVKVKLPGKTVEVHSDFKELMDDYEKFIDSYVQLLNEKNPDPLKYASMTAQYADTMQELDRLDDGELSDGDTEYYLYVVLCIEEKLLRSL